MKGYLEGFGGVFWYFLRATPLSSTISCINIEITRQIEPHFGREMFSVIDVTTPISEVNLALLIFDHWMKPQANNIVPNNAINKTKIVIVFECI